MKKHGVMVDPNDKPSYYGYRKRVDPKKLSSTDVILDKATDVYWNWKKSKAKSLEEARAKGYVHTKYAYKGYVGQKIGSEVYAGFKPDKLNKSGYFELYSELLEGKGFPAMPTYTPIQEHQDMRAGDLILTTYKVNVQTHSRTQNCKWLTEIYHENPAWINPATAESIGISDNDTIRIKSGIGMLETRAYVTPAIVPGVIAVSNHCGHWEYGRIASGKRTETSQEDPTLELKWWTRNGAHPNWIIPSKPDPVNGQMCWMDTVVSVSKA